MSSPDRTVILFGGTFDPPHHGHIHVATSAMAVFDNSDLLVVPAGDPWQKSSTRSVTDGEHRLEMCRLAFGGIDRTTVRDVEVRRSGPSYSIDTVEGLARYGTKVILLAGQDAAAGIDGWYRSDTLRRLVTLAVPQYHGEEPIDLPGWRIVHIPTHRRTGSSTAARRNLVRRRSSAACAAMAYQALPGPVLDYIERHGLYLGTPEAPATVRDHGKARR